VRDGYPGSPPTKLMAVSDKWVRPTRRPADLTVHPTDLGGPHDLLKTFQKILDNLIRNDLKTWRTRQDNSGFRPSRSTDMASVVIN
jgi:hypothetical protein